MEVKKAIVLDMDNTLECGVRNDLGDDEYTMFLRPDIDAVILKLKEAKEKGIDIILCTTAIDEWVEHFLALKPDFRELFTKIYSRDNRREWIEPSYKDFPIEYELIPDKGSGKPVTTFGYNSVLYIDDADASREEMNNIYADSIEDPKANFNMIRAFESFIPDELEDELEDYDKDDLARVMEYVPDDIRSKLPSQNIDTTFFKVPFFNLTRYEMSDIFILLSDSNINNETRQKIAEFIEYANKEPGCRMICDEIDRFMEKDFTPGLTMVAGYYEQEIDAYKDKIRKLKKSIRDGAQLLEAPEPQSLIDEYMSQDRTGPYIGILPEIRIKSAVNSLIRQQGVIEQVEAKKSETNKVNEQEVEDNAFNQSRDNR